MSELDVALALVGGLTLLLSLVAGLTKSRSYLLSEPLAATLLGVVAGPAGAGLLELSTWGEPLPILEQVARLTVGIAVVSIALRLPDRYFRTRTGTMVTILGPGMAAMWLISGLLTHLILGLPFWTAMLVGAIVTPTDPVTASAIVTGPTAETNIADRLRNLLSAESGANDGGAYPLVFLPILVMNRPAGAAAVEWITHVLVYQVGFAIGFGYAIGATAGYLEQWSRDRRYVEQTGLLAVTVALTATVLGLVKLLGSDGILAAFVAGLAFNRFANARDEAADQQVQEVINRLFTFPVFVFFGVAIPWGEWLALGWAGAALAAAILLFRRLPMVFGLRRFFAPIRSARDAAFVGWFGPIGVAAIFYATLSVREVGTEVGWIVGSLVVGSSILAHGVTSTPFTKLYGRSTPEGESEDDIAASSPDVAPDPAESP